jgi:hypothetical protein
MQVHTTSRDAPRKSSRLSEAGHFQWIAGGIVEELYNKEFDKTSIGLDERKNE